MSAKKVFEPMFVLEKQSNHVIYLCDKAITCYTAIQVIDEAYRNDIQFITCVALAKAGLVVGKPRPFVRPPVHVLTNGPLLDTLNFRNFSL